MAQRASEDKPDFQNIYVSFSGKIRRYLARLVGEADFEDVTQEVFLKVNAGLDEFRGDSSLSTWIYRIATNAAVDHNRKSSTRLKEQRAEGHFPDDSMTEESTAVDPTPPQDRQLIRKEMSDCIRGIVDGLPENYRTVLILSDLEELKNDEIAEVLDISLQTVKIRLHRARLKLKKELEYHCSFYKDERNELACDRKVPSLKFLKK
ncbi:MAG: sigma-70 family RNA polymerase sigma factor [Candidatus Sulfobium sp.]|jgi:RNA polymerase sigma-70 factor (ECF subfamily)